MHQTDEEVRTTRLKNLKDKLSYGSPGIITIRFRDLLAFHRSIFGLRQAKLTFPPVEIGSVTLVDQIVLLALLDVSAPSTMLEIGTHLGYATRLFLDNSSKAKVYSVDLPSTSTPSEAHFDFERVMHDGNYNDEYLKSRRALKGEIYLNDIDVSMRNRLILIQQDSKTIDYRAYFDQIEFAFIDGGHDLETVSSDTTSVTQAIRQGIVVWHDFGSGIHDGVNNFLQLRSATNSIFHVAGSLCAFEIVGV